MNIKQKLYLKQLDFLRPLLGLILLIVFVYFYGLGDFDKFFAQLNISVPHWVIYAIYAVFAIYALWRTFIGVIMLLHINQVKKEKCFFALLENPHPQVKINNIAEQYALLATVFYESSNVSFYDKSALAELTNNPNYIPPNLIDEKGNVLGESQYFNSIEGFSLVEADTLQQNLTEALTLSWEITDRKSALKQIDVLWERANEGTEYDLLKAKEGKAYAKAVKAFGFQFACDDLAVNASAFDLVRFIYLVRSSFTLGYLDEQEARSALLSAATFLGHYYKDWQHFAYSYLINFLIWNVTSNTTSMAYAYALQRILCANEVLVAKSSPLQGTSLDQLREGLKTLL